MVRWHGGGGAYQISLQATYIFGTSKCRPQYTCVPNLPPGGMTCLSGAYPAHLWVQDCGQVRVNAKARGGGGSPGNKFNLEDQKTLFPGNHELRNPTWGGGGGQGRIQDWSEGGGGLQKLQM